MKEGERNMHLKEKINEIKSKTERAKVKPKAKKINAFLVLVILPKLQVTCITGIFPRELLNNPRKRTG